MSMTAEELGPDAQTALRQMLGYLNFSSGAPDARFQRHLDLVYRLIFERTGGGSEAASPPWATLAHLLRAELAELRQGSAAFAEAEQAEAVITLVFDRLL